MKIQRSPAGRRRSEVWTLRSSIAGRTFRKLLTGTVHLIMLRPFSAGALSQSSTGLPYPLTNSSVSLNLTSTAKGSPNENTPSDSEKGIPIILAGDGCASVFRLIRIERTFNCRSARLHPASTKSDSCRNSSGDPGGDTRSVTRRIADCDARFVPVCHA